MDNDDLKTQRLHSAAEAIKLLASIIIIIAPLFFISNLHTTYKVHQYQAIKPNSVHYLNEIINPIAWKNRINFYLYSAYIEFGLKNQNPQYCRTYIKWAEEYTQVFHHKEYYKNLYFSYLCTGDKKAQKHILQKIIHLYPGSSEVYKALYEKLITEEEQSKK